MISSAYCYSWTGAFSRSNACIIIISSGHYFTAVTVPLILLAMTNHWRCYEITVIVCDTTCRIRLESSWSDLVSDTCMWGAYEANISVSSKLCLRLYWRDTAELAFQVKSHFIHPSLCKGYNVLLYSCTLWLVTTDVLRHNKFLTFYLFKMPCNINHPY